MAASLAAPIPGAIGGKLDDWGFDNIGTVLLWGGTPGFGGILLALIGGVVLEDIIGITYAGSPASVTFALIYAVLSGLFGAWITNYP